MAETPLTTGTRSRIITFRLEWVAALFAGTGALGLIYLVYSIFDSRKLIADLSKPGTIPLILITVSFMGFALVSSVIADRGSRQRRRPKRPAERGIIGTLFGIEGDRKATGANLSRIRDEIRELRDATSSRPASLSTEVQQEILGLYKNALSEKLETNIGDEIRHLVDQKFQNEVEFEASRFLDDVNQRLKSASSTVSARGFLNLILGIVSAGGALLVLQQAITILSPERLDKVPLSTVLYLMGTRVSIALIITLVAYFFLSLYKRSLEEAKFYQNEMTDMSSKAAALQLAYRDGDQALKAHVLSKLVESDRNRSTLNSLDSRTSDGGVRIVEKLIDKLPSVGRE